jgi:hypothetical protein
VSSASTVLGGPGDNWCMVEIWWRRRETRRQTENTNFDLQHQKELGYSTDKVASKLSLVCGESAANKERSCCARAIIAATMLNSQRPLRREATRRKSCFAPGPPRIKNVIPSVVSTSKAMANMANNRDHASISLTRASAKPRYHLASRNPSSQQNRQPYSLAIGSARSLRLLTRYHVSRHQVAPILWPSAP